MSLVTFRAATVLEQSPGAVTWTVAKPAGTTDGDFLVAVVLASVGSGAATATGWTVYDYSNDLDGATWGMTVLTKVASSEPASWTFDPDSGSAFAQSGIAVVVAYSGVDTTDPHDGFNFFDGSNNPAIAPAVVLDSPGTRVLSLIYTRDLTVDLGTPAGTTKRAQGGPLGTSSLGVTVSDHAPGHSGLVEDRQAVSPWPDYTYSWRGLSIGLREANVAPSAPTLTAPADGAVIARGATQRFAWTFSDGNTGDSQSAYELRYRVVGAPSWTTVTGGLVRYHDFAAGTFTADDHEWQVRTTDAVGAVGAWSSSVFFTADDAPAAPSVTDPINGQTVADAAYTVAWSTPSQDAYQVRTVADDAGTPDTGLVYTDTGEVTSTVARTHEVTFATNSRFEHVQVRVKESGLWSAWASVRVEVSYLTPPAPQVTVATETDTGSLYLDITNPVPDPGDPDTVYNDVEVDDGDGWERKATQVAPNGNWRYWTPRSGRDYAGNIRVTAVGDNGTTVTYTVPASTDAIDGGGPDTGGDIIDGGTP